jgi:hypothetical protein
MNPNHIDLPGTPIELEGEIIGYIDNKKEVMSEETVKYGITATEIVKKEYPHIYAGYMDIMEEQLELFSRKHLDYGMHNITAGTSLATEDEREFALTGLWYRISDKINRWKNLIISSRVPNNETIVDTFQDICNYAIIAQLVQQDKWKK